MARGWESKAVEAQQDAALERQRPQPPPPGQDASTRARLATLQLARTRAEADLHAATAPAHRAMLESAIAELSKQIDELAARPRQ